MQLSDRQVWMQRGVALVIVLILLAIMTMLAMLN